MGAASRLRTGQAVVAAVISDIDRQPNIVGQISPNKPERKTRLLKA
jgi:hypothetical protein